MPDNGPSIPVRAMLELIAGERTRLNVNVRTIDWSDVQFRRQMASMLLARGEPSVERVAAVCAFGLELMLRLDEAQEMRVDAGDQEAA